MDNKKHDLIDYTENGGKSMVLVMINCVILNEREMICNDMVTVQPCHS